MLITDLVNETITVPKTYSQTQLLYPTPSGARGVDVVVTSKQSLKINLDECRTAYDQGVVLVIGGREVAMDWSEFARLLGLEW